MKAALLLVAMVVCGGCSAAPVDDSAPDNAAGNPGLDVKDGLPSQASPGSLGDGSSNIAIDAADDPGHGNALHGHENGPHGIGLSGHALDAAILEAYAKHRHGHRKEICIPEIVAFSLLSRGPVGVSQAMLNYWPDHISSQKMRDMLYFSALAKSWPNRYN